MLGVMLGWPSILPGQGAALTPQVVYEAQHDVSFTLRQMAPWAVLAEPKASVSAWPAKGANASSRQPATTAGLNFDGIAADAGWNTADTSGAVGATQYVQSVNTEIAVYDKTTGALLMDPMPMNTLWSGFGGVCETRNDGDPITQYDKAAGQWIISHHAVPNGGPYYQCVALSTTSDATGSWYRYAFPLPGYFPDYPKLGVWPDAYYLTTNLLNQNAAYSNVGAYVCALDRSSMLVGAVATSICFQTSSSYCVLLPSDLDGATPPPTGSPNYFLGLGVNALTLWKFHVDFTTPSNSTFTGPTTIPVPAFQKICNGGQCIPQQDTTNTVDGVGDRLMARVAYRNFGSYDALVTTHSIGGGAPYRSAIRWYDIHNPGGTPVVYRQGTFTPDSNYRWLGSIGMDKLEDIVVGYNVSSNALHPSIRYAGRMPSDPPGSLEPETSIVAGGGSQQSANRAWNDVSSLSIDPADDCTFWYTSEYYKSDSTDGWSTRIASFKFTSCQ